MPRLNRRGGGGPGRLGPEQIGPQSRNPSTSLMIAYVGGFACGAAVMAIIQGLLWLGG